MTAMEIREINKRLDKLEMRLRNMERPVPVKRAKDIRKLRVAELKKQILKIA